MATKIKGDEEIEKEVEKKPAKAADPDKPLEAKLKGGGHVKPADMRKEVQGKPLEDLSEDVDSARRPYPHGSPRDPEDIFEEQHGYRRGG